MMDPGVPLAILDERRSAWAVTDRALRVCDVHDPMGLLGFDGQQSVGCSLVDLVPELVGAEDALTAVLEGREVSFDLALVQRRGSGVAVSYLTLSHFPRRDPAGRVIGLIHYAEDVTDTGVVAQRLTQQHSELRMLQEELDRRNLDLAAANAELRRADEMKSALVSFAAHELRSPLGSMLAHLELLRLGEYGELRPAQDECLGVIEEGARRMTAIVSNLLDLTLIESGRSEVVLRPTDLGELVSAAAAEVRPRFSAATQRLVLDLQPDLPPALCDAVRTRQILDNLLSNAQKYTPAGGTVRISLTAGAEAEFLLLAVADTGPGIPPEEQSDLFRAFRRTGSARRSDITGTGLGLYITHLLVELHGGRISFETAPGKGTTFHVALPVADANGDCVTTP